jgi:DNA polymerase/3'-5' exonuclease PolX
MLYTEALPIAEAAKALLAPHCHRIEIAGSIRRRKAEVKDIEIVAIPKPYDTGLFASGIATVVNQWEKVKGELPCRYTQRILPEGIKLDLFFAYPHNWGLIYAIRTGSADFSHYVLAAGWVKHGYHSMDGKLVKGKHFINVPEEHDLFRIAGVPYIAPELREFTPKQYLR